MHVHIVLVRFMRLMKLELLMNMIFYLCIIYCLGILATILRLIFPGTNQEKTKVIYFHSTLTFENGKVDTISSHSGCRIK